MLGYKPITSNNLVNQGLSEVIHIYRQYVYCKLDFFLVLSYVEILILSVPVAGTIRQRAQQDAAVLAAQ